MPELHQAWHFCKLAREKPETHNNFVVAHVFDSVVHRCHLFDFTKPRLSFSTSSFSSSTSARAMQLNCDLENDEGKKKKADGWDKPIVGHDSNSLQFGCKTNVSCTSGHPRSFGKQANISNGKTLTAHTEACLRAKRC